MHHLSPASEPVFKLTLAREARKQMLGCEAGGGERYRRISVMRSRLALHDDLVASRCLLQLERLKLG